MKQFVNKTLAQLRGRLGSRGESIVETLAAVLVCSLAILMLYTALSSAARMNAAADAQAVNLRESIVSAETQQSPEEGLREVSVAGFDEVYLVQYYSGETDDIKSYSLR